jgi:molecular chaperone HtpG
MTKKHHLQIHSENILPIIKKWLYTDKEIFLRELVSNACDALYKVKLLKIGSEEEFRIDITTDKEEKVIKISDTGIGMTEKEVVTYIAQIAFSGAEDFVHKYEEAKGKEAFIGHFGLGFYSSYMVAKKVTLDTLSYEEGAKPVFWSCDGSSEYEIYEGKRDKRGTEITLSIDDDSLEFLEESKMRALLDTYCKFLPYPIYLNGQRVNDKEPIWIKPATELQEEDYINFYRDQYRMEEDPLLFVHLNVDYPFHLKGVLYFPKITRDFDLTAPKVNLYCNRVFVSDNCKDVIPNYLSCLRGVIDSPDIPLNVSRSALQMDRTVRSLSSHISKKVSDSLNTLFKTNKEKYLKAYEDISVIIKLGILEDEKFYERVKDVLLFQTTDGEWVTIDEILQPSQEKILYTTDPSHNQGLISLYKNKGMKILILNTPIDSYLIQSLEQKLNTKFQRIDASVTDHLIDKEKELIVLDSEGKTEATKIADYIKKALGLEHLEVEAKSLATEALPGFVTLDETARRMRDYFLTRDPKADTSYFGKKTFVVNTNNRLVNALTKLQQNDEELAKELTKELYDLSLLSQREIDPKHLNEFITRSHKVLEMLTEKVLQK